MVRAAWVAAVFACFVVALTAATECGPGECDEAANMKVSMLQVKRANESDGDVVAVDQSESNAEFENEEQHSSSEEKRLDASLDSALTRKGHARAHHHNHQPHQQNYNDRRRRSGAGGRWDTSIYKNTRHMTVYHQTSPEICKKIVATNFLIGRGGWCGKGVYFAMDAKATSTKAITAGSHGGCMLEVVVDAGNALFAQNKDCNPPHQKWNWLTNNWKGPKSGTPSRLKQKGKYDSVIFHLGDGDELIIYDPSRIKSKKIIPWNEAWTVKYHQR